MGFCCEKCGRLSCREFWDRWQCANPKCNNSIYPTNRTVFTPQQLANPHRPVYTGPTIPENTCADDISCSRCVKDSLTILQYELGECGTVTHILSNEGYNSRQMDANYLLEQYQQPALPFRRHCLNTSKSTVLISLNPAILTNIQIRGLLGHRASPTTWYVCPR
jgi:hypothetical protein